MTVSSEAKRTLVKSPPELWSEVSDAESLARHLDRVGQIRITRVEPETAVEWEAEGANGSVRLQPSGFGTKVTLSLSRELPPTEPAPAEREPAGDPAPEPEPPEPVATEPTPKPEAILSAEPGVFAEPVVPAGLEPLASEPAITQTQTEPPPDPVIEAPRAGFFARLFKRRRKPIASAIESIDTPLDEPEPVTLDEPEPMPVAEPIETGEPEAAPSTREPEATSEPEMSLAADLAALEAEIGEQDEAMLTAMLDRLGAAHHRPFSRS